MNLAELFRFETDALGIAAGQSLFRAGDAGNEASRITRPSGGGCAAK
jgi:hypothetical protein